MTGSVNLSPSKVRELLLDASPLAMNDWLLIVSNPPGGNQALDIARAMGRLIQKELGQKRRMDPMTEHLRRNLQKPASMGRTQPFASTSQGVEQLAFSILAR